MQGTAAALWRRHLHFWLALVLIGITVLKVFVYDLARLSSGYRILATTALGVALLAISFAYQRDWLRLRGQ